ncbi:cadherin-like domain-containing protein [Phaeovulum sp.]|uniref:cadherin-like domain-containing protein n=1 Tax=Phaeovulum sp. TaxID=2934796 RepID=UPI0039E489E5
MAASDDFADGTLDAVWRIEGPSGVSSGLGVNTTDAYLALTTPDGSYDVWDANNGARAMQDTENADFQIETRFLSQPTEKYQMQGLLVEQDAENWLRFDTYSDGKRLYAFAAITLDGVSSNAFKVAIPENIAPYLQLTRAGDQWTFAYSQDGVVWTTAGSFSYAMDVTSTGVFAGNTGAATGFTAQVDYFENTAQPILDEDGIIPVINIAPEASNDALGTPTDTPLTFTAADLLNNDSDGNGDPLTVVSVTQPGHGALVDNGNGSFTYTPAVGFEGVDSFSYTVSDGILTDSAAVRLTIGNPAGAVSDDFSGATLGSEWEFSGIAGSAVLGVSDTDAFVSITSPAGVQVSASDVLTTPRLLQAMADTDFQISAGFLDEPGTKFQEHGLLVVQDSENWIRFDLAYNGGLKLIVGLIEDGVTTYPLFQKIGSGLVSDFRITRSGDTFQFEYSQDGQNWTVAHTLTRAMTVAEVGVFAGSTLFDGPPPGYVTKVDYFENSATPIVNEDGNVIPQAHAPVAGDDMLSTALDTTLSFTATELLANDTDANGDTLSISAITQPLHGVVSDTGNGTYSYTPASGYSGPDSFTYSVSDGALFDIATVTVSVAGAPPPVSDLASDDFSTGVLDPVWQIAGPAGVSASVAANATDAYLALVSPDGSNDVWNTNNGTRAMQAITNDDFQIETRFLSQPTAKFQMQGLLVEQDAGNWVRFDTYSDGKNLYAFAAVTVNGKSTAQFKVTVPGGDAPYLQVTRDGDQWTFAYSTDGETWTAAGSFSHSLVASSAGVFAANTGAASGFTALVDYFENTASPIMNEDGNIVPVNVAPVAGDDAFSTAHDSPLNFSAADLLANDTDANGDALTVAAINQPSHGTLINHGDGTYTYAPAPGYSGPDSFTYTVTDGTFADIGAVAITVTAEGQPPTELTSDDFAAPALNPVWQIAGPAGVSASVAANATDAYLALVSPDGSNDVWNTNNGTRAMQAITNDDFQIETRFLSQPTAKFQMQGLLVEQDAGNWVRFDTYSDGKNLYAFAAVTVNGKSTAQFKVTVPGGDAPYLQVTRDGDQWTFAYSTDGETWTAAGSFSHSLVASSAGVFAANTGAASGFTALVDYFENTASPIMNEDGNIVPVNVAPVAGDDQLLVAVGTLLTFDAATLLANDTDLNDDALGIVSVTQPGHGTLTDNADGTFSYLPVAGWEGTDTFTYTVSDGDLTDTAEVSIVVGNPVNLWYGPNQSFGAPGEGQEWINILGNVAGDVASLSYSLNGGPAKPLSLGEDTRRLHNPGDFNVDIAYGALDGSNVDDVVTITATMTNGQTYTRTVTVDYEAGHDWAPDYAIDWATVTDIQDVVQVADGTWAVTSDGVRPVDTGYDRLLVLGDQSWDNYELNLTITMHDLHSVDPRGRDGGGFAIGMLWNGHNDSRFGNMQPHSGYEPGAAFFYTDLFKSHSYDKFSQVLGKTNFSLDEGVTYNFTVRVEQVGLYDRQYSLKVWEEGSSEPVGWTLQTIETFTISEAPATGSIYLNAHYYDVTFGDILVSEITGRDIIQGTDADERLAAVDLGTANPGAGEIDVFVGGGGADTFVFGDANGAYYNDGDPASSGIEDYAFVWDFNSGTDIIELAGTVADYTLTSDAAGLPDGTAIWLAGQPGEADELIGVLNGVYGLNLSSANFQFVDLAIS